MNDEDRREQDALPAQRVSWSEEPPEMGPKTQPCGVEHSHTNLVSSQDLPNRLEHDLGGAVCFRLTRWDTSRPK